MFDWPLTPPKQVTLLLSLILAISCSLASYRGPVTTQWIFVSRFWLLGAARRKRVSGHLTVGHCSAAPQLHGVTFGGVLRATLTVLCAIFRRTLSCVSLWPRGMLHSLGESHGDEFSFRDR